MSWMSDKTGKPKEEGGHKRINISVNEFIVEGLKKVGNKSQFLEKVARPMIEKLDPGEASVYLWRTDILISQGIISATEKGDFKQVQALGWMAGQLEDARKLCGVPPLDFKLEKPHVDNGSQFLAEQVKRVHDLLVNGSYSKFWRIMEVLRNEPQVKPLFDDSFKQSALKHRRQVTRPGELASEEVYELVSRLCAYTCAT